MAMRASETNGAHRIITIASQAGPSASASTASIAARAACPEGNECGSVLR